jgi:hypothetical protein
LKTELFYPRTWQATTIEQFEVPSIFRLPAGGFYAARSS